jgi:hypothetical protein
MKNLLKYGVASLALVLMVACNQNKDIGSNIEVTQWGPQETRVGKPINVQPDGSNTGLWFEVIGYSGNGGEITFNGKPTLETTFSDKLITTAIPISYLSKVGNYEIAFKDAGSGKIISIGTFKVLK